MFPGPRFDFVVAPPTGTDTLYAIVSGRPIRLPSQQVLVRSGFYEFQEGKGLEVTRGFELKIRVLPQGDWGVARRTIITYR